tara:strand:- start:61 stop:267 length:207 start_codon:yes stop_codon:yes gene_type:complete
VCRVEVAGKIILDISSNGSPNPTESTVESGPRSFNISLAFCTSLALKVNQLRLEANPLFRKPPIKEMS